VTIPVYGSARRTDASGKQIISIERNCWHNRRRDHITGEILLEAGILIAHRMRILFDDALFTIHDPGFRDASRSIAGQFLNALILLSRIRA